MRTATFILVIFLAWCASCNRHDSLPPARCRFDSDCVPYGTCAGGICRLQGSLEGTVAYVKVFRKKIDGAPLVIRITVVDKERGKHACTPPFSTSRRVNSPSYPHMFRFAGIPRGTYRVEAYMDIEGNGEPDRGEPYVRGMCSAEKTNEDRPREPCNVTIIMPR